MIDLRILKYSSSFGKCVLKGSSRVFYFESFRRKSNGKFWMRISCNTGLWFKPYKRSLSLSDFEYLELK